ncbi:hypothetical protein PWG71_28405 [Nocardiopsis sp. N85]|uniref:hypothetical protein n=1 Tax=Nocardiopsis sp. N85 TaxID=3029400 RepID=UPI00237F1AE3|nr:hypothetical protein [Nocardiopsis sp. N85]MDE3725319.1 hypothetical protein [Nocardiopsis sp. N85]
MVLRSGPCVAGRLVHDSGSTPRDEVIRAHLLLAERGIPVVEVRAPRRANTARPARRPRRAGVDVLVDRGGAGEGLPALPARTPEVPLVSLSSLLGATRGGGGG